MLVQWDRDLGARRPGVESPMRSYMKAYYLRDLRRYGGWDESRFDASTLPEGEPEERAILTDDSIVYLGDDYRVTRDVFDESPVIFDAVTEEWRAFCHDTLGFEIPEDAAREPREDP